MNMLDNPILKEFLRTCTNMYNQGWDERNGGNISYRVDYEDIKDYIDTAKVIREIPIGFNAKELSGMYFLVTGTGSYFKNIELDPIHNMGLLRIKEDGVTSEILWGFEGGKFTSELPAHLMTHIARLKVDKDNRVVTHCHPDNILALTYILELNDETFTKELWQMETECIMVFPEGIGVLPWMVCGTNEIGIETAKKMEEYRLVIWAQHGIYSAGNTLDETYGLIETVEKAARVYLKIKDMKRLNTLTDDNLKDLAKFFDIKYNKKFLK